MELIVDRPLANTYGWLHANGTKVTEAVSEAVEIKEERPAQVSAAWEDTGILPRLRTGAGEETGKLLQGLPERVYRLGAGEAVGDALRLHLEEELGEAAEGYLPSRSEPGKEYVVSNPLVTREGADLSKLKTLHPEIFQEVRTVSDSRRFSVKLKAAKRKKA